MIDLRTRATLGSTSNEWLEAAHHFSFAHYQHSGRNAWGDLLSLNHNVLAPRAEMRPQPIDGTEIVTFVRKGVIAHAGSMGGKMRVATGEVELVSSGRGMTHASVNPGNMAAEYFEIRIASRISPDAPARTVTRFPGPRPRSDLVALASGFAEDRHALTMRAEARVLGARLREGATATYGLIRSRHAYIVTCGGEIAINGTILPAGSGAAITEERTLCIRALKAAEILLIDAP
jgi:redox-sensitive bicupin YhaK (pirin superfamily)